MNRIEPITFNIDNNEDTDQQYNLLGAQYNGTDLSHPGMAGPDINVPQSSTAQMQRSNLSTGFRITRMLISVSDPEQFQYPITVKTFDMTGVESDVPISPGNYESPMNANAKLIELNKQNGFPGINVNDAVGLTGTIKAKSHMHITMDVEFNQRKNFGNFIGNKLAYNPEYSNLVNSIEKMTGIRIAA